VIKMPIKIINRSMDIPILEQTIGYTGDNLVEARTFELHRMYGNIDLSGFDFRLDTQIGEHENVIYLDKTISDDKITLTWVVDESHIQYPGDMTIQIRAFNAVGVEKWHTDPVTVKVKKAINALSSLPSPLPPEFNEMEARVAQKHNEVMEAAEQVAEDKAEVAENLATVLTKAQEAAESAANALQSEINAKTSEDNAKESETSALEAMQTAVQAMTDLLNMLGTDIATLTGGKLTPSQIPAIAITDTFVRDSEAAMLALDCETGDVCIRTDENQTYILQGTDPSKLSDWQQLKTPTNYADEAGHAVTADNAENANKINNKRLVAMTESQYDVAAKDPETFYAVTPD